MKTIEELRDGKLNEVLARVRGKTLEVAGDCARLILYGSHARGEGRDDSDVDLMVVVPDEKMNFKYQDRIRDAIHEIGIEEDYVFQVMIVTESQMEKFKGFMVFDSVEKEGIVV